MEGSIMNDWNTIPTEVMVCEGCTGSMNETVEWDVLVVGEHNDWPESTVCAVSGADGATVEALGYNY
jgi:hypothetical protein